MTSTPSVVSVIEAIESPKMYSVVSLVRSYMMRERSPRVISTLSTHERSGQGHQPLASLVDDDLLTHVGLQPADSTKMPMRFSTLVCASPRKSTAKPPPRNAGARSTTVGLNP